MGFAIENKAQELSEMLLVLINLLGGLCANQIPLPNVEVPVYIIATGCFGDFCCCCFCLFVVFFFLHFLASSLLRILSAVFVLAWETYKSFH